MTVALTVEGLNGWYGDAHVVQGVSFALAEGKVTALLGRNGAGKTTLLKGMMGLLRRRSGQVRLGDRRIDRLPPHRVALAGLSYIPETRGIFPSLTVLENLTVAARPAPPETSDAWTLDRVFDLFPRLAERRQVGGGQLSGGEQQMLAIARALLGNGRLLLIDEPTEGLAPAVVADIEAVLQGLKQSGITVLLVEQNYPVALRLADYAMVLGKGRLRWFGGESEFQSADEIRRTWLGV